MSKTTFFEIGYVGPDGHFTAARAAATFDVQGRMTNSVALVNGAMYREWDWGANEGEIKYNPGSKAVYGKNKPGRAAGLKNGRV